MISDIPKIEFNNNTVEITGRAIPEFAAMAWNPILNEIRKFINLLTHKKLKDRFIIIDFKLDYFNSASNPAINKLFDMLTENAHRCKPTVNWFYFEADEKTMENGEIYKERNTKVTINLVIRDD